MKAITSVTIDVDLLRTMKKKADAEGISFSALLERALRKEVTAQVAPVTPQKLSKKAQIVLDGVRALHNAAGRLEETDIRFHAREYRIDEVCKKVGLFPSTALPALRECERAGALKVGKVPPIGMTEEALWVDHWRLPA